MTGDNADIEVGGTFYLGTGATMIANINSDSFSTINVPGTVNFAGGNGTLEVNFIDGYARHGGTSWILFDSPTVGAADSNRECAGRRNRWTVRSITVKAANTDKVVTLDYINTLN